MLRPMTEEDWKTIEYFTAEEMGAVDMDLELMLKLDGMRKYINNKITVNVGYATRGHSSKSQHYVKRAADIVLHGCSLLEQYRIAERFNFNGLGVYPHWNTPGIHVDTRPLPIGQKANRWWRDENNKYWGITVDEMLKWNDF